MVFLLTPFTSGKYETKYSESSLSRELFFSKTHLREKAANGLAYTLMGLLVHAVVGTQVGFGSSEVFMPQICAQIGCEALELSMAIPIFQKRIMDKCVPQAMSGDAPRAFAWTFSLHASLIKDFGKPLLESSFSKRMTPLYVALEKILGANLIVGHHLPVAF